MASLLGSVAAFAHGGAEVSAYPQSIAPGETLFIEGADINPNGSIAIFLDGVQGRFRLGEAQGDEEGGFKANLTLAEDIPAGRYLLKAIGTTGTTASTEVTIATAGDESSAVETRMASPEQMELDRPRSSVEWVSLISFLSIILLTGTLLIKSRIK